MYRCYNLKVEKNLPIHELEYDKKLDIPKTEFQKNIRSFITDEKTLDAKKIIDNWFPNIKADIFISHSHADIKYISRLTSLFKNIGLRTFVDYDVWGYSDKLLKTLDDKYCRNNKPHSYDYQTRNKTTSSVHIMLSTALAYMIDNCECVIFVNTPNSITPSSYITDEQNTFSPWLYNELVLSQLIRRKSKYHHRNKEKLSEARKITADSILGFLVEYPAPLNHMINITDSDIFSWKNSVKEKNINGYQALDLLYENH